ncbi:MAG: Wzz/FepE/Etk N-terminal domain-containing protein [Bacteroidales bacterium]
MQDQNQFNTIELFKFLIRNFKALLILTLSGAIVSIIVSLLITPKFKSVVVIFAASTSSVSKALLTDMSMTPKDILKFGEEEETEQLLQILHSDEITARIIKKHDLLNHYEIDSSSKYFKSELLDEYYSNISFRKTEFQAIEIKVMDTKPEYAAAIANDIAALLDSVYNKIQKDRAYKALKIVETVYADQRIYVDILKDSINSSVNANNKLNSALAKQLDEEILQLSLLKSKLNEAKVDAYQDLPHKYIVNPAQVSERKSYPVRWLIVVISTISTFVFGIFFLLILERLQSIRKELSADLPGKLN